MKKKIVLGNSKVLHSEVLWPDIEAPVDVNLSCDLFGQAGRYLIWVIGVGPGQPKGKNINQK